MYTQCPDCQSVYRMGAEQLRAANGRVRCGRCGSVFDALDHPAPRGRPAPIVPEPQRGDTESPTPPPPASVDAEPRPGTLPDERSETAEPAWANFSEAHIETLLRTEEGDPVAEPEPYAHLDDLNLTNLEGAEEELPTAAAHPTRAVRSPESVPDPVAKPIDAPEPGRARAPEPEPVSEPVPEPVHPTAPGADGIETDEPPPLPLQLDPRPAPLRVGSTLGRGLVALLLVAALGAQYAHFHSLQLAGRDGWRPYLESFCALTGCQLPARRDLESLELAGHTVQSHPRHKDALLITATLRNRGTFPQPYPVVEVIMSDLQQRTVAARRFRPEEYLAGSDAAGKFPVAGEAHLLLEVVDPGPEAVSFQFNFY